MREFCLAYLEVISYIICMSVSTHTSVYVFCSTGSQQHFSVLNENCELQFMWCVKIVNLSHCDLKTYQVCCSNAAALAAVLDR